MTAIARLLTDFDAQRPAALARAVSIVENQREGFDQLLAELHPRIGRARRIGMTGPPGAGKSTITTLLVQAYRAAGLRVGVVAVPRVRERLQPFRRDLVELRHTATLPCAAGRRSPRPFVSCSAMPAGVSV
jgi:ATPase subunit of ABC transporter with duplicated ATPase domains